MRERRATSAAGAAGAGVGIGERLRSFFSERIWEASLQELPRWKAALFWAARFLHVAGTGVLDDRLSFRAAALTYFTVLSVVPFLAFAFAVLKGFGVYGSFIDGAVRPYVDETFAANQALYDAVQRILQFVDETDVSRLGTLGVVVLVYAAVTLVSNVEVALNEIFEAKTRRPVLRQVTDYVTLLVIAPILLLAATTFSAAAQSSFVVRFLRETLALGPVIDFALGFTSVLVVGLALLAMYLILPNVRVRLASAVLGAAFAGLLWQGALVLHVRSQMGVARYNALYSVLGAIPIFLVWTYVSWLVVLVGARVAAAHQGAAATRQRLRARRADAALKEALAVAVAARVARDFLDGGPRPTAAAVAERLEVPPPLAEEILEALVRAGVLARVVSGREPAFVPGRDLDEVRLEDVRDALRREPGAARFRDAVEQQLGPGLLRVVRAAEEQRRRAPHNLTLRALAALEGPARREYAARGPEDGAGGDGDGADVVDEKQPDVPA